LSLTLKEQILVEGTTLSELIREAFIDPLRSVLIVDDQYPTWEEILNNATGSVDRDEVAVSRSVAKNWRQLPNGPLGVIKQFRSRNPGFIIDIHDALAPDNLSTQDSPETATDLADHLYQSDLLILDYNLEGDSALRGKKARSILQSVLLNKHFNLIVVHTGEHDLEDVFFECLLTTMQSCTHQFNADLNHKLAKLDQKLDDLEVAEEFDREKLSEYFGISEYIEFRRPDISQKSVLATYMRSEGGLSSLSNWAKEFGLKGGELRTFLYWVIREYEKPKLLEFSQQKIEGLKWYNEGDCKWLRTVRGFVSFVGKGPDDLLGELQKALESWKPTPSRLLSAKYRHELSRLGVEAEDRTLLKRHVFAHFYKDILKPSAIDLPTAAIERLRAVKLKDHVSRQSEEISFHIESEIVQFGERIIATDNINGNEFSTHYGIDLTDPVKSQIAVAHYNSYISTLPLKQDVDQLDSGHIFKLKGQWYVCATPACDLQPGQNAIAFGGDSHELRPFTGLLLKPSEIQSLSPDHINSGTYCFVENEPGKIVALGLRVPGDDGKPINEKVTWRTFLATNNGVIEDNQFTVLIPKLQASALGSEPEAAHIVAKLRYEYALSYIQKVGASVSRIGLGYSAF
jgi:hypothetical protein